MDFNKYFGMFESQIKILFSFLKKKKKKKKKECLLLY